MGSAHELKDAGDLNESLRLIFGPIGPRCVARGDPGPPPCSPSLRFVTGRAFARPAPNLVQVLAAHSTPPRVAPKGSTKNQRNQFCTRTFGCCERANPGASTSRQGNTLRLEKQRTVNDFRGLWVLPKISVFLIKE